MSGGSENSGEIQRLQREIAQEEAKIKEFEANIAREEGKIKQFQANIVQLTGELKSVEEAIKANNDKITSFEVELREYEVKETSLREERDGNQAEANEIEFQIYRDTQEMVRISQELERYHQLYQENLRKEAQENGG